MNIKHASLLRAVRLRYIQAVLDETPAGMRPDMKSAVTAADRFCKIIKECWDKLNHRQKARVNFPCFASLPEIAKRLLEMTHA